MNSQHPKTRQGFSLVELLVVLLLAGIVAVFVASRFQGSQSELVATRDMLLQNLTYARSRAMASTNTWTLSYGASIVLLRDGESVPLPDAGNATVSPRISITPGSVAFASQSGVPASAPTIVLTDNGGNSVTLTINATTGLIE